MPGGGSGTNVPRRTRRSPGRTANPLHSINGRRFGRNEWASVNHLFDIRARARREVAKRLIELAVFILLIVGLVVCAFWVTAGVGGQESARVRSDAWVPQLRAAVTGRITAEQSLAIALAMLALNATINVALAIPQNISQWRPREQVSLAEWRRWLDLTALFAAGIAVFAGIAAWLGPSVRSTSLISVFADAAALLCVALMVSIAQATSNAAEREMNRARDRKELDLVLACKDLLPPTMVGRSALPSRRLGAHLVVVGLLITLVSVVISAVTWWALAAVTYDKPMQVGWVVWAAVVGLVGGIVSVPAVGIGSFLRWSWYYTPPARLNVISWGIRIAYVFMMTAAIVWATVTSTGPQAANSMMFWVALVGMPVAMWWIIGRTRRNPLPAPWMLWLASPLWYAVAASLSNQETKLRSRP